MNLTDIFDNVGELLQILVLIGGSLALLFYIWNAALLILNAGNEEKRKEGKAALFWGMIGLFVLYSLMGLVTFLSNSLGI